MLYAEKVDCLARTISAAGFRKRAITVLVPAVKAVERRGAHLIQTLDTASSWLAARTRSRFEFRIESSLQADGIEIFLPQVVEKRNWKGRPANVNVALLSGYLFTRPRNRDEMITVLQTHGVCSFVSFAGAPARIPEQEIETLRTVCSDPKLQARAEKRFLTGEQVVVIYGPFHGKDGVVMSQQGGRVRVQLASYIGSPYSVEFLSKDIQAVQ